MAPKKRFSRSDWVQLGLENLAHSGPSGITIDALCRSVGKTKGSFYSHFTAITDFNAALAELWQHENTALIIDAAARVPTGKRRQALDAWALELNHDLERNMRQLSFTDAHVAAVVTEVDDHRIALLAKNFVEVDRFSQADALALARFEYGFYVAYQAGLRLTQDQFDDSYQRFLKLVKCGNGEIAGNAATSKSTEI
ncbi:MAG: TetR/AcrR family transcriptional regulator [Corynebacterium sp.]|uniref:TetR/AcrR family transcriptional regulator n=1 Tax=Corynebacterium sp. TaxID=1720 RepID=UPI0026DA8FBC|nr:TetR/AcrR family transcriptional regulator [Corynebacterium sp.]MDO5098481.1 TetR/AcrR family transcriptional regulator [Corynebacterium sp.]